MAFHLPSEDPNIHLVNTKLIFITKTTFYLKNKIESNKCSYCLISSWEEAYALHGPAKFEDINPAYLANLITLSTTSIKLHIKGLIEYAFKTCKFNS